MCIQLLSSCQNYDKSDNTIYFVGDSEIANWGVEASFPNRITRNLGHDGMRLRELCFMSIEDGGGSRHFLWLFKEEYIDYGE